MATARIDDEPLKCPICFEHFDHPKQLPDCFHVFCEKCLLTYIGHVKSKDDTEHSFQCPVCRKQVSVPLASSELSEWVNSLELKFDMESSSTDLEEGLVKGSVCGPCEEIGKILSAEKFCIDCQEYLCKNCSRLIHAVKVSKTHSMFDLRKRLEGEEEIVTQRLVEYFTCSRHSDKAVSFICHEHDDLCCINCIIENHRHCDEVKDLKGPIGKTDTKTVKSKMNGQIQNAFSQIQTITYLRRNNAMRTELVDTQIREIRTKINTVFDAFEESVQSKAKALAKNFAIETDNEIKTLEEKKQGLTAFLSLIKKSETEGSDRQQFIVFHKIKSKMKEIEKELCELRNKCCRHELSLQTTQMLDDLIKVGPNDTSKLATVKEDLLEAILPYHFRERTFNIRAEKIAEHDIWFKPSPVGHPTYCSILSYHRDQLILIDSRNALCCLTDQNYKPIAACFMKDDYGTPFCATNVKHGLIAISFPEQLQICFLSEEKNSKDIFITGTVKTRIKPKALCGMKNGDIAVSWQNPVAFGILTFSCNSYVMSYKENVFLEHDTAGRAFKTFDYMAIDEERSHIIQPCKTDRAVYCFDFSGNPKFAYSTGMIHNPNGVACDGQGNIYICDESGAIIHIVSADGKGMGIINFKQGCPTKLIAIAFYSDGIQFAVTKRHSPPERVTVFKLLQKTKRS